MAFRGMSSMKFHHPFLLFPFSQGPCYKPGLQRWGTPWNDKQKCAEIHCHWVLKFFVWVFGFFCEVFCWVGVFVCLGFFIIYFLFLLLVATKMLLSNEKWSCCAEKPEFFLRSRLSNLYFKTGCFKNYLPLAIKVWFSADCGQLNAGFNTPVLHYLLFSTFDQCSLKPAESIKASGTILEKWKAMK